MVRDPRKGEDEESQLCLIDVRFTYVVDCALAVLRCAPRALVQRTLKLSSGSDSAVGK